MEHSVDRLYGYLIQYGMNLLAAILIFLIGRWAAQLTASLTEKALATSSLDKTLARFAKNIVYFAILTFVCIAALNRVGVETSSFLAVIGAAGLAIGLALQGALSNFAAGVMMIIFRPFHVEDYVEAGGAEGKVTEIQIFSTVFLTKDNKKVIVPNSKITGDKVVVHPSASPAVPTA